MCGLVGIFAYHKEASLVDRDELLRIRERMILRGPDGAGSWISPNGRVGLAHRRLSIIDLSEAGAQPMLDPESGNQIVFNGEIYNYRQLRAELETAGHRFRSHSDTEVLLKLYAEHGPDMLPKLRGMYAFGIWSEHKQGIFLARDPFGIKPLYIADDGKTLRFASQVKALLAGGRIDTTVEPAGHVGFYLWGHVPEPYTLYKGIRALPAGTSLWVDVAERKTRKQFFNLAEELALENSAHENLTPADARKQLHAALLDSVRHHLVADVPVGVFLSAGLDSTTIAALAREVGVAELHTVTLGFREFEGTINDETILAEIAAQHCSAVHQTRWVRKADFTARLGPLLDAMDQPSIDGVNSYFVSLAAKEAGLKVALSGLGGDELFGGYSHFQTIPRMVNHLRPFNAVPGLGRGFRWVSTPFLKHLTSPKAAGLFEYGGDYPGAYLLRRGLYMPWQLPDVLDADIVREGWQELASLPRLRQTIQGLSNPRLKVSALETCWYMRNQLLRDTDWASMAHSVEVRVPLVDTELTRAVTRLVHAGLAPGKQDMAASPVSSYSQAVHQRKKTGFSVPVRDWLSGSATTLQSNEIGLKEWAEICHGGRVNAAPSMIGLLASEVCTRGGVQSFMLRIAEVIGDLVQTNKVISGCCISLNDSTASLRQNTAIPSLVKVWGANRSKAKLLAHALLNLPSQDVLFVGHVGIAPLAHLLKLLGRVQNYYVILHGIEAWRRMPYLERRALLSAKGIIATTRYTADECAKQNRLPPDRFKIIPLCADDRTVTPSTKFKLDGQFKLLCVARQDASERYKGFEHIFQALAQLQTARPNIHLNMVGIGNDQDRLKRAVADIGLAGRITFWGALSDEELAAAYRECDLFVMPSKKEGFGIVFLEAMRHGKPCIGGNHGGTPDVISDGKNGYLIEYGNVTALAECIRRLNDDAALKIEMGQTAKKTVADKFSSQLFATRYSNLVQEHVPVE